ncbi:ATP-binding cassette domain-containing protein [Xanthobacter sediminis]|uniref:ATP-binding cassette domain-containing protein n=1 Tax=Xanthobacter sediminis TaxID=3119926 RepID=UPI0037282F6F
MSLISVRHLWKEYDDRVVLEDIDLEIEERAFVALVGPSGCGKTTFLKMLLSEEVPTRGVIELDGKPIPAEPGPERGVVYQRYSVFPHLTVLGNVVLARELGARDAGGRLLGRLFGAARRAATEKARELLAAVGLSHAADKYPSALSGGMQQRLALAQALMAEPRVLLLDEPFGALDPGIRADIHVLMRKLWHERALTAVMVTHDLPEAFGLATRVIAFERRRDEPTDGGRYGARIAKDIGIWPPRVAGAPQGRP